mmetsp:Transcript_38720/g.110724  ORF Transcript_38720/g.110724 Transcript_38720/m.110724 type:complete len:163 (-) Transcript_38720:1439-1927(-)
MAGVFLALLLSCLAAGRAVGGGSFIHPHGGRPLVAQGAGKPTPCVMRWILGSPKTTDKTTREWDVDVTKQYGDVEGCPDKHTCVLEFGFVDAKHGPSAYGIGNCRSATTSPSATEACEPSTMAKDKEGEPLCFEKQHFILLWGAKESPPLTYKLLGRPADRG